MITLRLERQLKVLLRRFLTQAGIAANVAVAAAAVVKAIAFADGKNEPDANYVVLVAPSWNTTTWITAKATTGFTINFGTAAPGGGGFVDYAVVRSE